MPASGIQTAGRARLARCYRSAPRCARMNHFCVIDRCKGTMAGCGASKLAAATDDEIGPAVRGLEGRLRW